MWNDGMLPLQINSIKELHLPLEDDGLVSHHGDNKMAATKEQLPSPTNKDHSLPENNLQVGQSGLSNWVHIQFDLKPWMQIQFYD